MLRLLFASFPASGGDSEGQLAAYAMALDGHDLRDIETAIRKLVRGEYQWHNQAFAPSSAILGSAVSGERNRRLESERRQNMRESLALPAPTIEHTPEQRERAKAMVEQFVADQQRIAGDDQTEQKRRDQFAKVNAYFMPEQSERAIAERLLGYSTGSPESEEHAA